MIFGPPSTVITTCRNTPLSMTPLSLFQLTSCRPSWSVSRSGPLRAW